MVKCPICHEEYDPYKDEWLTFFPRKSSPLDICAVRGAACVIQYLLDED